MRAGARQAPAACAFPAAGRLLAASAAPPPLTVPRWRLCLPDGPLAPGIFASWPASAAPPGDRRAVDEYRSSAGSLEPLYTVVEDGDYHFVPGMTQGAVRAHKASHARGTPERHIDAVFWRKGGS